MYFKKLELIGFKSFAEKTVLHFEHGVTAVVGPNGCGKSNISDAIKWVLGEQSPKSLRGLSMEDMIFSGTDSISQLGFAEVSLTLSNESRRLPIEYEEVTITRRLFRSGESEYLLNKSPVRLKDIQELLMGTGIGLESYSFIEQGKMDAILSSKPEERRLVFEEASGITKYKSKKREALRKLEQTEENLLRVGDIINEVRRQIDSVERQAKKARRYQEDFELLKKLEVSLARNRYSEIETEKSRLNFSLLQLNNEEAGLQVELTQLSQELSSARNKFNEIMDSIKEKTAKSVELAGHIEKNRTQISTCENWLKQMQSQESDLVKDAESLNSKIGLIKENIRTTKENTAIICNEALKIKEDELRKRESSLPDIDARINQLQDAIKGAKLSLMDIASNQSKIKNEHTSINASIVGIAARIKRLQIEREKVVKELSETESKLSEDMNARSAGLHQYVKELIDNKIATLTSAINRFIKIEPGCETSIRATIIEWARAIIIEILDMLGLKADVLGQTRDKLKEELSLIDFELNEGDEEMLDLKHKLVALNSQLESLEKEYVVTQNSILLSQQMIEQCNKEHQTALIEMARLKAEIGALNDKGAIQSEYVASLQESLKTEETNLNSKYNQIEDVRRRQAELHVQIDSLNQGIDAFIKQKEENDISLVKIEEERLKLSDYLTSVEFKAKELRQKLDDKDKEITEIEAKIADEGYQQNAVVDRIRAEYKVELMEIVIESEELDIDKTNEDIVKLKERLERLGPVNLAAIEEQKELNERWTFLINQQGDLLKAKESLKEAISKINKTTHSLFADTFERVRLEFQNFFKLLFAGGEADLILLDEKDILECGIEIVARPPGKKLQNVGLLSGGEKALVAIALLFGLFKVNPSPFCVLDEIDAPLDEANIDRFINALNEFVKLSQFIIITHNKKTIIKADVMYGITMERSGVSKVVSVKFANRKEEIPQMIADS